MHLKTVQRNKKNIIATYRMSRSSFAIPHNSVCRIMDRPHVGKKSARMH